MVKEKCLLAGPFIGELGWEILRFSSFIIWKKVNQYKNIKLIVLTRSDSFDLYGQYANILSPLVIDGDATKFKGNCFRLDGYSILKYKKIAEKFFNKYQEKYEIVEHIFPIIDGKHFMNKSQFQLNQRVFNFKPRVDNLKLIESYISNDKPIVVLAPRYRENFKRNWPHWNQLFDLISNNQKLMNSFNFIICGKSPEYIPDNQNRFFDINHIQQNDNTSLIGLTIEVIKKSILVIGSQSALPNLSMILKTKSIQWGHQKKEHTKDYNIFKTPVIFLEDRTYTIEPLKIFNEIQKQLLGKEKKHV